LVLLKALALIRWNVSFLVLPMTAATNFGLGREVAAGFSFLYPIPLNLSCWWIKAR